MCKKLPWSIVRRAPLDMDLRSCTLGCRLRATSSAQHLPSTKSLAVGVFLVIKCKVPSDDVLHIDQLQT